MSLTRINNFLNAEEVDETTVSHLENRETPIIIKNASFRWGKDCPTVLDNISLTVNRHKLIAIVGQVGAGKSSLLSSILGDLEKLSGYINISGSVAYVPQQAWIQNSSLRQNILFINKYDQSFYNKVIESCALGPDIEILSAKDMTEIGEKGINLSGGQKQRVSLARAVYSDQDIYLLDDPLSAVDAHVSRHLFAKVIGPNGILRHKTRILVTHRASVLTNVDQIVVLKDGTISEMGTFEELIANNGDFSEFVDQYIQQKSSSEEDDEELQSIEQIRQKFRPNIERSISKISEKSNESDIRRRYSVRSSSINTSNGDLTIGLIEDKKKNGKNAKGGQLIEAEASATGSVKGHVYKAYFVYIGLPFVICVILCNVTSHTAAILSNLWLSQWADDGLDSEKRNDTSLRDLRLGVYGALGGAESLLLLVSSLLFPFACLRASKMLHNKMLDRILRAPMSFFGILF